MCSHNSCIRCTDLVLTQAVSWNNGSTQALCSKQSEIHLRLSSTRNCFSHSLISSSLSRFFKEKEVCMQDKCQTSKSSENTPQRQGKCPFQSFGSCAQSFQWHVWLGGFVYFFFSPLSYQFSIFDLVSLYLGQSLENTNCSLQRHKHSPTIYPYTPTLPFLFPTESKNETIHSRPKLDDLAEIKQQFSKGFWIQREKPREPQNTSGLTDS